MCNLNISWRLVSTGIRMIAELFGIGAIPVWASMAEDEMRIKWNDRGLGF